MNSTILVINQSCSGGKISYDGLENLKDGLLFSGKYESGMSRFPSPILIVLSNNFPDLSKMGSNRFRIYDTEVLDAHLRMTEELRTAPPRGSRCLE